ncbi:MULTISPECIES: LysR family transcriptional regulator [Comamonas]|jgi:DNA-binding transcriptional LysR family regulator|uniref:LysR family transcriptional regulator n=1 Tax=Comamonas TaxID=283 RepID=UPI0012D25775|nr:MULTISPECIES: LysR family transcriptional regulator [Comamonas]MDR3064963.1 LysR family transcriptional regulator [Comamonas sp.]MEB5965240.1 LysR family transcriptional regulator [Comamonas testosteroni]MPS94624.1 LysR family transcriptional regulator [Comamonas sp.]
MNLSSRDVQAFLVLARQKNFTQAASMCHLSQPAFSALIRSLEQTVGLKLFDRSTRHVVLTTEGERFLQSAERLCAEFAACEKAMRDTAQLTQGHVSVALLPSLAAGWLPAVLKAYTARHPGIQLGVLDVLSEPCIASVANGDADFALAAIRADTPDLRAEPFCSDSFHMVCPRAHPLANKAALSLEDLTPWPFIHLARHSSVRQYLDAALFPRTMQTFVEVEQLATAMGLVQAGLGITVAPALSLFHFNKPGLVTRQLPIPDMDRQIYMVRKRERSLSLAAQALYQLMQDMRPASA